MLVILLSRIQFRDLLIVSYSVARALERVVPFRWCSLSLGVRNRIDTEAVTNTTEFASRALANTHSYISLQVGRDHFLLHIGKANFEGELYLNLEGANGRGWVSMFMQTRNFAPRRPASCRSAENESMYPGRLIGATLRIPRLPLMCYPPPYKSSIPLSKLSNHPHP
jgi:hypothetical protein